MAPDHLGDDVGQDVVAGEALAGHQPTVTAGLKCPPEMCPRA